MNQVLKSHDLNWFLEEFPQIFYCVSTMRLENEWHYISINMPCRSKAIKRIVPWNCWWNKPWLKQCRLYEIQTIQKIVDERTSRVTTSSTSFPSNHKPTISGPQTFFSHPSFGSHLSIPTLRRWRRPFNERGSISNSPLSNQGAAWSS